MNTFSLATPPCHHCHCHYPPNNNCIPSPSFLCQIKSCYPLLPILMEDCVFWGGGGGRGTKLRPPHQKGTLGQFLIVVCLSYVVSDETLAPLPQELMHHNKDRGGHISTPPHPRKTAVLAASPAPRHGSSFSSKPPYSCHAEPWRSTAWPMINAAGCRAKSSPSRGAVVPIQGCAHRRRPRPSGPPCVGVARGWHRAAESGVKAEVGTWVLRHGHHRNRTGRNMPASPPAGCRESHTRTWAGQRHGSTITGASRA
jgi:hypothetical protein